MQLRRFILIASCVLTTALFTTDMVLPAVALGQSPNGRPQGGRPGPSQPGGPPRPDPGASRPGPGANRPGSGSRPSRPQQQRPTRQPQGRPRHPRPHYSFGDGGNGFRLRRYFNGDMAHINRNRRPHFLVGGYFPRQYVTSLQPIPPDIYGYLPPVPPGYSMGYYDGYTVVYDPATFVIASVLDLFRY